MKTQRFIPALDGIRALGVLEVILYHCRISPVEAGWMGVSLFFSLSGYLITSLLIAEFQKTGTISIKGFYIRRIRRIYPALVLVILGFIGLSLYQRRPFGPVLLDSIVSFAGIANWTRAFNLKIPTALGHLWSLAIECQFYLIWGPLCFLALSRSKNLKSFFFFCLTLCIFAFACRFTLIDLGFPSRRMYNGLDTRIDDFAVGAALATLLQLFDISKRQHLILFLALLGTAIHFYFLSTLPITVWRKSAFVPTAIALSSTMMVLGASQPGLFAKILSWRPLRYIGEISYGLYLWHYPILRMFRYRGFGKYEILAAVIVATFACAALSYHLVEKRFLPRKRVVPQESDKDL